MPAFQTAQAARRSRALSARFCHGLTGHLLVLGLALLSTSGCREPCRCGLPPFTPDTPATTPDTPATTPDTPATTPDTPATAFELDADAAPENPWPSPLPQAPGVTVRTADFAFLPGSQDSPAEMMTLVDEPGAERLFVNDMNGTVFSVSYDGTRVFPYLDLRSPRWAFSLETKGPYGVQSVAFHPEFGIPGAPGYGRFYTASDIWPDADGEAREFPLTKEGFADVVFLEWSAQDAAAEVYDGGPPREVFRRAGPVKVTIGFNALVGPESSDYGMLFISLSSPHGNPQNRRSVFGKILRIDPLGSDAPGGRYGIPADNPFVPAGFSGVHPGREDRPEALHEIYAYGMRHPQRFAWDPDNGNMFVADIGAHTVEEISLVPRGGNLGWRDWEGSFRGARDEDGSPGVTLDDPRSDPEITWPVVEFDHVDELFQPQAVAITGIVVYRDNAIPQLEDLMLFGDLVSGEVFYVKADELPAGGPEGMGRVLFFEDPSAPVTDSEPAHAPEPLLQMIQERKPKARRADMRLDRGPDGTVFLINKQDGVIRLLTDSSRARSALAVTITWLESELENGTGAGRDVRIDVALPADAIADRYAVRLEAPPGAGFDASCTLDAVTRPLTESSAEQLDESRMSANGASEEVTVHQCGAVDGALRAEVVELASGQVVALSGATVLAAEGRQ